MPLLARASIGPFFRRRQLKSTRGRSYRSARDDACRLGATAAYFRPRTAYRTSKSAGLPRDDSNTPHSHDNLGMHGARTPQPILKLRPIEADIIINTYTVSSSAANAQVARVVIEHTRLLALPPPPLMARE